MGVIILITIKPVHWEELECSQKESWTALFCCTKRQRYQYHVYSQNVKAFAWFFAISEKKTSSMRAKRFDVSTLYALLYSYSALCWELSNHCLSMEVELCLSSCKCHRCKYVIESKPPRSDIVYQLSMKQIENRPCEQSENEVTHFLYWPTSLVTGHCIFSIIISVRVGLLWATFHLACLRTLISFNNMDRKISCLASMLKIFLERYIG